MTLYDHIHVALRVAAAHELWRCVMFGDDTIRNNSEKK